MKFLADENFPAAAVLALTNAGHDVISASSSMAGSSDLEILARAAAETRAILTFDKDFGELAYRHAVPAGCGVILFRFMPKSPEFVASRVLAVIETRLDWHGVFAVAEESRVRVRMLDA